MNNCMYSMSFTVLFLSTGLNSKDGLMAWGQRETAFRARWWTYHLCYWSSAVLHLTFNHVFLTIYPSSKKMINIYILFNHKCSSRTSSAMHVFTHCVITLEKSYAVSSSSVYSTSVQKGRAKNSFNFKIAWHRCFTYFCKGFLTFFAHSLCKVLPPTLRVHDYIMHKVKLVQDEHLY